MFSSSIGMPSIIGEVVRQTSAFQSPLSVDTKVALLGKRLHSLGPNKHSRSETSHSFSPLRFLWWASLLAGARAQLTTPFTPSKNLGTLTGLDGFVLNGEQANDWSGYSVASAGDVNGDGIADLLIGAQGASSFCRKELRRLWP